jgi:steroid delta-isomerase-like uncharacterized protein
MAPANRIKNKGQHAVMAPAEMNKLIEQHIAAESAGDVDGAVAMYSSDDVIHDVVGSPLGPLHGPDAAKGFYEFLTANVKTERIDVNHAWYGEDFCVLEHECTGTVTGEFLGIPGNGKRISFRLLHLWEFKNGRISRENVWLDGGSIAAQLTPPEASRPAIDRSPPQHSS